MVERQGLRLISCLKARDTRGATRRRGTIRLKARRGSKGKGAIELRLTNQYREERFYLGRHNDGQNGFSSCEIDFGVGCQTREFVMDHPTLIFKNLASAISLLRVDSSSIR